MSNLNTEIVSTAKVIQSHHPWENRIKDKYSNKYKYSHNSVNNPIYPPTKEDYKTEESCQEPRTKFTVIGNRVTKEFIYCLYLIKGLFKYRQKHFEAPIITGVTGVEWPKVWNHLKIKFGDLAFCLKSQVAVLKNDQFLGGEDELKQFVETKYVYRLYLDYNKEGIQQFANYIKSSGRPCAYLQISINKEPIGSLIFMLYSDIVPLTCQNFLQMCEKVKGGYGGSPIHRIVKDCWIQCGGYNLKNPSNLVYENFVVPHDRRGVLCMANDGRNVDCSTQFFVLLQPATWMDKKYVAFGQLIDGERTLSQIENVPTWYESPTSDIIIDKAGIFNLDCQKISINKNVNAYIQGHIENLAAIGQMLYERKGHLLCHNSVNNPIYPPTKEDYKTEESCQEPRTKFTVIGNRVTKEFIYCLYLIKGLFKYRQKHFEAPIITGVTGVEWPKVWNHLKIKFGDLAFCLKSQVADQALLQKAFMEIELRIAKKDKNVEEFLYNRYSIAAAASGILTTEGHHDTIASEGITGGNDLDEHKTEEQVSRSSSGIKPITAESSSIILPKPVKPFYLPLTDVPYPGEVDSVYNLEKFMRGDYCLENDLAKFPKKTKLYGGGTKSVPAELIGKLFEYLIDNTDSLPDSKADLDFHKKVGEVYSDNLDRVSLAGRIVTKMATLDQLSHKDLLEGKIDEVLSDDTLRMIRVVTKESKRKYKQIVSIKLPDGQPSKHKIYRRQTGMFPTKDIKKFAKADEEDEIEVKKEPKQRINVVPNQQDTSSPTNEFKSSVLNQMFRDVAVDYEPVLSTNTLQNYTPPEPLPLKTDHNTDTKCHRDVRQLISSRAYNLRAMLNQISPDPVTFNNKLEFGVNESVKIVKHSKRRPSLTVAEYQMKNRKYREDLKQHQTLNN